MLKHGVCQKSSCRPHSFSAPFNFWKSLGLSTTHEVANTRLNGGMLSHR